MDVQVERFDALNDVGQDLVQLLDGQQQEAVVGGINAQLQLLQERWDHLVHLMEHKSKEVQNLPPPITWSTKQRGANQPPIL